MALPAMSTADPQACDLAIAAATLGVGIVVDDGLHCGADELAGHGDRHEHVGARVLDGLERADGPAELLAHLRVAHRRGQHCFRQAQAVAGDGDRRPITQSAHRGSVVPVEPQHLGGAGRRDRGQPARLVEHRLRGDGRCADCDAVVGDDEDPVGALGVGYEVRFDCDGHPDRTGCHICQQSVASIAGLQRFQCADGQYGATQIAVGTRRAAYLLAHHRGFGERGTGPAELLGHFQPDPPGVDEHRPVHRAVLGQQIAGDRAQLVVELRIVGHQMALGSRGRPRPRSPMMVRWISLAPPGIVHSHDPMKSSIQAPDSQPLDMGFANSV